MKFSAIYEKRRVVSLYTHVCMGNFIRISPLKPQSQAEENLAVRGQHFLLTVVKITIKHIEYYCPCLFQRSTANWPSCLHLCCNIFSCWAIFLFFSAKSFFFFLCFHVFYDCGLLLDLGTITKTKAKSQRIKANCMNSITG